ncbi:MAG: single-stranded DNA-binding protein [Candidatus Omnitrophica bacterium]|nr:single-stranded DNA-binding protein [Candidatus Omnitrophota bacterium]MBU4458038.1 single-stranded DNA-binding protein [Candidatus Omnitrophota bacterium]
MANLNKVFLMGNLTRDPELRYVPSGAPVATFGLAVNRRFVTQQGEKKDDVCFVQIVVFGKQAENCSQYLSKGRPVFIEGRLRYRSWEQDGQKRSTLEVIASWVQFLGGSRPSTDAEGVPVAAKGEFSGGAGESELKPEEESPKTDFVGSVDQGSLNKEEEAPF